MPTPLKFTSVTFRIKFQVARGVYIYFLAKMTELLDTVFFVIRKKERQITFLHMYHHTVMPMISWGATKYYPGGHGTLIGVMNSFVHIIMYTYYMFAAMGPKYQRWFSWKRHITTLQMVSTIYWISLQSGRHAASYFYFNSTVSFTVIPIDTS